MHEPGGHGPRYQIFKQARPGLEAFGPGRTANENIPKMHV